MRKLNTPGLPHASGTARTHYNQWCCLHQMRDTTRQIGRSKLSRPIYDELKQKFKCPVDRLNLLCCDAASGLDTVHGSALTPRLLHALSVEEESRRMLPHFLLTSSIYRGLIRIWPIWRNPHQYTPDVNLKTLVQTRIGDMNGDDSRSAI